MPRLFTARAEAPHPHALLRRDLLTCLALAVGAGALLGAMIGSRVAGTDEPLPDRPEVLAIARLVWDEREPDESWVAEYSPEELRASQVEHEDVMGIPGWAQVLFGDATMDETTGVSWPDRPGWVEPTEEPYGNPETPEDNARRLDEAEAALTAAGWDVSRPYDSMVQARRGTLVVNFWAPSEGRTPDLDIARVPPAAHAWLMGLGAVLGATSAVAAMAAFVRHRRRHPPIPWTGLAVVGLALIGVNVASALLLLFFSVADSLHFDEPLWRSARFIPFGFTMNLSLLFIAISVLALWRQHRRQSAGN